MLNPGAVAIHRHDIVDIDTPAAIAARYTASETIDAHTQVVLPGLIKIYTHVPMVMYQALWDELALMERLLQRHIFQAEVKMVSSPESVRGARVWQRSRWSSRVRLCG